MIKLISPLPDKIEIICSTKDELEFCNSYKDKVLDMFIRKKTKAAFKTLNEYLEWNYAFPEFGTTEIIAKWNKIKEWGLQWDLYTISELQYLFNNLYKEVRENDRRGIKTKSL